MYKLKPFCFRTFISCALITIILNSLPLQARSEKNKSEPIFLNTLPRSTQVFLPGNSGPLNTGVFVHKNEFVKIDAVGKIFNGVYNFNPDGGIAPPELQFGVTILPNIASNSLVGSIGSFSGGTLLDDGFDINPMGTFGAALGHPELFGKGYLGSYFRGTTQADGDIYLAFNDTPLSDNTGGFTINITVLPIAYYISGQVLNEENTPIVGIKISTEQGDYSYTNASGVFTITALLTDTYTIKSTLGGYKLSPPSKTVSLPPDILGQNFIGTAVIYLPFLKKQ